MKKYKFNPLDHGYEPISNYPELSFNYPIINNWFIKIIVYDNLGGLVYWYSALSISDIDDRIKIYLGSYNTNKPATHDNQNKDHLVYFGLISSDEYAKQLLTHLFGTTYNESVNVDGLQRYNQKLGEKMRLEFKNIYYEN